MLLLLFGFIASFSSSLVLASGSGIHPGACGVLLTQAIPASWVTEAITKSADATPEVRANRAALQQKGFRDATLNHALIKAHTDTYSREVPCGTITNQKQSGTCWDFAALNWMRAKLIRERKIPADFEFSQAYIYFFSLLEKSNAYLEKVIRKQTTTDKNGDTSLHVLSQLEIGNLSPSINDGGRIEMFLYLTKKYGMVPKAQMPSTVSFENTSHLRDDLENLLAAHTFQMTGFTAEYQHSLPSKFNESEFRLELLTLKANALSAVLKLLVSHLGIPPSLEKTFEVPEWKGDLKTYTPLTFSSEAVGFNSDDYVKIASFTDETEGKAIIIPLSGMGNLETDPEMHFNTHYLNLSVDRMLELLLLSLKAGHAAQVSVDSSHDIDSETGIMHPQIFMRRDIYDYSSQERGSKLTRARLRKLSLSESNHALIAVGYDLTQIENEDATTEGPIDLSMLIKIKIANTWGEKRGSQGYFHAYTEWLRRNLFYVVIRKEFLTPAERTAWENTRLAPKIP